MNFDPYNRSPKIWKSIETPILKMGAHLGMWRFIPSHFPTFLGAWDVTLRLHSWPTPLQARALVARPNLRLQQRKRKKMWSSYNVNERERMKSSKAFEVLMRKKRKESHVVLVVKEKKK
jgi:hypothetical protein